MGQSIRLLLATICATVIAGVSAIADGARTNAHDTFNVRNHYSHTTLKDFVPSTPAPAPAPTPSPNPAPQPDCNTGNNGHHGGHHGGGHWGGGNNWGSWNWGISWGTGNWGGGNWGNWGGGHVHGARCYWVNGGYQWQTQYVWIPDHWERQWTPPVYRYEVYDGQVYPVLVRDGYYADVYINGYYETRNVRVWVDGYWICR